MSRRSARILVIEDDPGVRFNIRSYLEDSGYRVDESDDGARGIQMVRQNHPDLVLCDLRMPGMDGLAVLRHLRAESPELPAIAVSGTGVLADAVEALREGAWDFVMKPIQDMAVLEHAIQAVLERADLIRENNRYQRELEQANRTLREQLRRIEEDADAGRRIQLQLMPRQGRSFGEYSFARYLLPSMYLSGDFVDYFRIGREHLGFFLADVSGHGVSSAFITVLLKGFMQRALERLQKDGDRSALEPTRMLMVLNQSMLRQGLDKYLTIFYGVIDRHDGLLTYANAGHFPGPVLIDGGAPRFLPDRGMPVGLFPEARFESAQLRLAPGSTLVLCSDGVLETLTGASLDERLGRLLALVDGAPLSVEGLAERLGLDPHGAYPDDIAFLILKHEEPQ